MMCGANSRRPDNIRSRPSRSLRRYLDVIPNGGLEISPSTSPTPPIWVGDYQEAVGLYEKAWETMEEIQDQDWELTCLFNRGGARVGLGEYDQAVEDLQEVLQRTESSGWLGLSLTHYFLAEAYLGQGKVKKGEKSARKAFELAQESGSSEFLGAAWRALGNVSSQKGKDLKLEKKTYSAQECYQESERIYREAGADGEQAYTLKAWGKHELRAGKVKEGEKLLAQAREIFQRLGMTAEFGRMDNLLRKDR